MRGQYDHHKEVKAAQGIKIAAHGLENAVAGTQLLVLGKDDDVNVLKEEVMEDMQDIFSSVDRSGERARQTDICPVVICTTMSQLWPTCVG